MAKQLDNITISLIHVDDQTIRSVSGRTGKTEDAVRDYLSDQEAQDNGLLDAFLFFGVAPVGKRKA